MTTTTQTTYWWDRAGEVPVLRSGDPDPKVKVTHGSITQAVATLKAEADQRVTHKTQRIARLELQLRQARKTLERWKKEQAAIHDGTGFVIGE